MSQYRYLGTDDLSNYVLYIRRLGFTAWLELSCGYQIVYTDYVINSVSFVYEGGL